MFSNRFTSEDPQLQFFDADDRMNDARVLTKCLVSVKNLSICRKIRWLKIVSLPLRF